MKKIGECPKCGRKDIKITAGFCHNCYRKFVWKRKKEECKRCNRRVFIHARGYCGGCYNFVFHLDYAKAHNYKKKHNLSIETYREITKHCIICGFDKAVDLHHLDENSKNNDLKNLVGLCPNHHRMFHTYEYRQEILNYLREKGYEIEQKIRTKPIQTLN